ncbi:MAG: nitrous oxide reductase family maturation protein NosD [Promethearchaeota archaeon]
MIIKNKINIILLALGVVFAFFSISNYSIHYQGNNNGTIEIRDETNLKKPIQSSYWHINFIHIDGNWSETETTYDWCSGDGSWGNPYTIENVTIDLLNSPTGYGIFINNSKNDFFIIKNCTTYNGGTGIMLENTSRGTLKSNNCSNNWYGIHLDNGCNNNTISGNIANTNKYYGIYLWWYCDNNNIFGNTVNNNMDYGIYSRYSNNNTILGNTVEYNDQTGIYLLNNCSDNIITGNTVNNNNNANAGGWPEIYLEWDSNNNVVSGNIVNGNNKTNSGILLRNNCGNNTVSSNTLNDCYSGIFVYVNCINNILIGNTANNNEYGIYLKEHCDNNVVSRNMVNANNQDGIYLEYYCDNNTILENAIYFNDQYGVFVSDHYGVCVNNLIYLNTFINQYNARDNGNNQWDNGTIGNYWIDYDGKDANDDGIGDIPYFISGTGESQDNFPIWEDGFDINFLSLEIFDQIFSKESFNITFYIYNGFNEKIDFAAIQMWWNGTDVSNSVQNLGNGLYFVSLTPITVVPGEDPILLKIFISALGYEDKLFETYLAVDPNTLDKDSEKPTEIFPLTVIIVVLSSIGVVGVVLMLLYQRKRAIKIK